MSNETADRIGAVARELLLAEGTPAVSMRRVAAAVGVTPMAIYRHYPSREAMLAAVADTAFAELAATWRRPGGGAHAELHGALDVLLDLAVDQPHLYRFLFTERRADARTFPDDMRAGRSPTLNLLAGIVRDGIREGALRDDDAWDVAFTIAAHIQGLILLVQGGRVGPVDTLRAYCHASLERLIHGLAP